MKTKKFLSLSLAILLVFSVLSLGSFAAPEAAATANTFATADREPQSFDNTYAGPFVVGDTRIFYPASNRQVTGKLLAQGDHVNIWTLDDTSYHTAYSNTHNDATCKLRDFTLEMAQRIADDFDISYKAIANDVASHAGVLVTTNSATRPLVGDLGEDGKINFLLYNFTAATGQFDVNDLNNSATSNQLDMLRISLNDLFDTISDPAADIFADIGIMAHEYSHFLFYLYYSVYGAPGSLTWINEALAELINGFYAPPDMERSDFEGRWRIAGTNDYSHGNGATYSDFLSFPNKGYGIMRLYMHVLNKSYPGIGVRIYDYFRDTFPPAKSLDEFNANRAKMQATMEQEVGDFLFAGTGVGEGGIDTIKQLYFYFMESYLTDGGTLYYIDGTFRMPVKSAPDNQCPLDNLWATRPFVGTLDGRVFIDFDNPVLNNLVTSYQLNQYVAGIPSLVSGATFRVSGFRSNVAAPTANVPARQATNESMFRLPDNSAEKPLLTITVGDNGPAGANAFSETRYYVAVMNDDILNFVDGGIIYRYASGRNGADVYALIPGVATTIDTQGREAFLFGVTFYRTVEAATIEYNWDVRLDNVELEACVDKLNGNQNKLFITVTEAYSDGSTAVFSESIMINNNAAGVYQVGPYKVYVDTKGNTQIRECYIIK